ncbi:MAG: tRNA preQ1(34) S-adenosylmethionine ribosyltransferase-isomerase QueA [Gammaproteobacteria bacterium]
MKKSDFYYTLPERLIAQQPLPERGASRLLHLDMTTGRLRDRHFTDFIELINAGDLLVFNDTKVIPARLFGRKATGGKVEILIERIADADTAIAHVRASKSPKAGAVIGLEQGARCEVLGREGDLFRLRFEGDGGIAGILERLGHIPLPPYITRADDADDLTRYQTVYAREAGAVAAPTAGLHFDRTMLDKLSAKGVQSAFVTLHVGSGTFQPVRAENLVDHVMHKEYFTVPEATAEAVRNTRDRGGRVVAIGTTAVRALESASSKGHIEAGCGDTRLFITPGYRFNSVDALLTNFHLPESTLLMLVSAFAGYATVMAAYRHAVEHDYRFFSYGDAMFLSR